MEQYGLPDLIRQEIDAKLTLLYTTIPAIVDKFDDVKQTLNVTIAVNTATYQGKNISAGKYKNIPIMFPSASDWVIAGPVVVGDSVLLLVPHYGTEDYFAGNKSRVADPKQVVRYDLNDAVAIPGMFTSNSTTIKQAHKANFHIAQGNKNVITMNTTGGVRIEAGTTSIDIAPDGAVTINATAVNLIGNVAVTGNIAATGSVTGATVVAGTVDLGTHVHPYTDSPVGPAVTSPPTP